MCSNAGQPAGGVAERRSRGKFSRLLREKINEHKRHDGTYQNSQCEPARDAFILPAHTLHLPRKARLEARSHNFARLDGRPSFSRAAPGAWRGSLKCHASIVNVIARMVVTQIPGDA